MKRQRRSDPKLCLHKSSGQGRVRLEGRQFYCGKFGTRECEAKYHQLLAKWKSGQLPGPQAPPLVRPPAKPAEAPSCSVAELLYRYLTEKAVHEYQPNEVNAIKSSMKPVRVLHGLEPAEDFSPKKLLGCVDWMIAKGWVRKSINQHLGRIKRIWKWGVVHELVDERIFSALKCVDGLRIGRSGAKENPPVRPVSHADFERTIACCSPVVAALHSLQRWSGARAGELVKLRTCDIERTSEQVWTYRPADHKNSHRGHDRFIPLGPKAIMVLKPWLKPEDPESFLFQPAESARWWQEQRRAQRQTRRSPSQLKRKRKAKPKKAPGEFYTVPSLNRAIRYACAKAKVEPWSTHQLRHLRATELRAVYDLDTARTILGQKSLDITAIYAEADHAKALNAAQATG